MKKTHLFLLLLLCVFGIIATGILIFRAREADLSFKSSSGFGLP